MFRPTFGAFCAAISLALFSSPTQAAGSVAQGPAVFGTAALATSTTPYDARWNSIRSGAVGTGEAVVGKARRLQGAERLNYVNRAVNEAIDYRSDKGDTWASASQSFARGAGDCEDYAIAKMQVLRAAGVPASDLFLVIGRDLAVGSDHAMLVVRSGGSFWVLDNFVDEVRADSAYRDFRPVITLSIGGSWLHGYKVTDRAAVSKAVRSSSRETLASGSSLAAVTAAQIRK